MNCLTKLIVSYPGHSGGEGLTPCAEVQLVYSLTGQYNKLQIWTIRAYEWPEVLIGK